MPMYNLIDCSEAYSKASRSLWHSKKTALDGTKNIIDFLADTNNSISLIFI